MSETRHFLRCSQILSLKSCDVWIFVPLPRLKLLFCAGISDLTVSLQNGLKNWSLDITFRGNISHDLAGFYRSTYQQNFSGIPVEEFLAITDFEPANARKAFPCFDEPGSRTCLFSRIYKLTIYVQALKQCFS